MELSELVCVRGFLKGSFLLAFNFSTVTRLQISVPHSIGVMKLVSGGGSFSVPFMMKLMNKNFVTVL